MINIRKPTGAPDFSPLNSLLVDDRVENAVRASQIESVST